MKVVLTKATQNSGTLPTRSYYNNVVQDVDSGTLPTRSYENNIVQDVLQFGTNVLRRTNVQTRGNGTPVHLRPRRSCHQHSTVSLSCEIARLE